MLTETERTAARATGGGKVLRWILRAREIRIVAVVILTVLILAAVNRNFLTVSNFWAVAIGLSGDAILAVTMTAVLITGGFDLSVGSVLALSGVIVGQLLHAGVDIWLAIPITLLAAGAVGAVNGLIITKVRVNPLITTLGMMGIAQSLALVISGGYPVARFSRLFRFLGQGFIAGIPTPVVVAAVAIVAGEVLLRFTRWMRLVYFVGSNEEAARLAGIPVDRVKILAYISCSVAAGFAGILATSRLSAAFPLAGEGTELRVISACVIGGCSLSGGEGTVLGSFLGVVLMALIKNGLVLLNVSLYWQGIVSGAILIGAVTFDMLSRRRRG